MTVFPADVRFDVRAAEMGFAVKTFRAVGVRLAIRGFYRALSIDEAVSMVLGFVVCPPYSLGLIYPVVTGEYTLVGFVVPGRPVPLEDVSVRVFDQFLGGYCHCFLYADRGLGYAHAKGLYVVDWDNRGGFPAVFFYTGPAVVKFRVPFTEDGGEWSGEFSCEVEVRLDL